MGLFWAANRPEDRIQEAWADQSGASKAEIKGPLEAGNLDGVRIAPRPGTGELKRGAQSGLATNYYVLIIDFSVIFPPS